MAQTEMDRLDWTNELTLRFLDLYRLHPCIWDPKNESHRNRSRLNAAWMDIKNNMGVPFSVKELKKKKESLMAAYRSYRSKIKYSEMTGSVVYRPPWFAFPHMDAFLRRVYKVNRSFTTKTDHQKNSEACRDPIEIDTPNRVKKPSFTLVQNKKLKRQYKPVELQQAKERMDQAFSMLKSLSKQPIEEDECHIFGRLIAEKLRRLSEERRDMMMIKISKLFYKECSDNRPPSSSSIRTYLHYDSPSPISTPKVEQEDEDILEEIPESRELDDGDNSVSFDMECETDTPNNVVTVFEDTKDLNHFIIFKEK